MKIYNLKKQFFFKSIIDMSHSEHSESVTSCITFEWPNCTYEFFFTAFRFVHVL